MTANPVFVHTTEIQAGPERVWEALTDLEETAVYWGHANVSDWRVGSPWEHRRTDGTGIVDAHGVVEVSEPPHRLVLTWAEPAGTHPDRDAGAEGTGADGVDGVEPARVDGDAVGPSRVTLDLVPAGEGVRVTVTHENLRDEAARQRAAGGWSFVLKNLKNWVEGDRPDRAPAPAESAG
ncbi:SRPBCC domain-containing protein (plasmid) [Streptomyces sp. BI20]|uniref:SRPBCC domain-containing protein n=1 Tax=Streptomyces sp. BI20 TaxID=3403460 RepID=UPI003C73533B